MRGTLRCAGWCTGCCCKGAWCSSCSSSWWPRCGSCSWLLRSSRGISSSWLSGYACCTGRCSSWFAVILGLCSESRLLVNRCWSGEFAVWAARGIRGAWLSLGPLAAWLRRLPCGLAPACSSCPSVSGLSGVAPVCCVAVHWARRSLGRSARWVGRCCPWGHSRLRCLAACCR